MPQKLKRITERCRVKFKNASSEVNGKIKVVSSNSARKRCKSQVFRKNARNLIVNCEINKEIILIIVRQIRTNKYCNKCSY